MNWRLRIRQWITALRLAHGVMPIPWAKMFVAMLTPVPKRVWRERIRTCRTCPLFDVEHYICCGTAGPLTGTGCRCYLPFKALSPEPYVGKHTAGCYGHVLFGDDFGWPAYGFPSRWAKCSAFIRFLIGK